MSRARNTTVIAYSIGATVRTPIGRTVTTTPTGCGSRGANLAEMLEHPQDTPPELHQTSWCTDRAIDFIEADHGGNPWLMSVNIFDPHAPFDPPQPYMDRFDVDKMSGPKFRESDLAAQAKLSAIDFQTVARRPEAFDAKRIQAAYYAMIELIDDNVGRMLDALERSGQLKDTVIIFTSDHGEMLGDHGLLLKGCRFYEGLVRVPLIISWPERFLSGMRRQALVELIDIAPTLLELAGLPIPKRMQGMSLGNLLRDANATDRHRDAVRCEYYRALNPAVRENINGAYATMIRDERYKLVVYHGHGIGELFDLESDPDEFENRWHDPAMIETKLDLMQRSFDALALATDTGPEQLTGH